LVRNPAKADNLRLPNVELVQGDLENPASLDVALAGVERAFIVTAVDQRCVGWFRNFFEAAKRAGTPHVVKYSGLGAGVANSVIHRQHFETDEMLRKSGLAYTILQPNSFYQNMLWSAGTIKDHGAICGDPSALIFKDRLSGELKANVCGDGDHVGLRVEKNGLLCEGHLRKHDLKDGRFEFGPG
jgi:uncharacterized protein YbjT (DUF2867 family)